MISAELRMLLCSHIIKSICLLLYQLFTSMDTMAKVNGSASRKLFKEIGYGKTFLLDSTNSDWKQIEEAFGEVFKCSSNPKAIFSDISSDSTKCKIGSDFIRKHCLSDTSGIDIQKIAKLLHLMYAICLSEKLLQLDLLLQLNVFALNSQDSRLFIDCADQVLEQISDRLHDSIATEHKALVCYRLIQSLMVMCFHYKSMMNSKMQLVCIYEKLLELFITIDNIPELWSFSIADEYEQPQCIDKKRNLWIFSMGNYESFRLIYKEEAPEVLWLKYVVLYYLYKLLQVIRDKGININYDHLISTVSNCLLKNIQELSGTDFLKLLNENLIIIKLFAEIISDQYETMKCSIKERLEDVLLVQLYTTSIKGNESNNKSLIFHLLDAMCQLRKGYNRPDFELDANMKRLHKSFILDRELSEYTKKKLSKYIIKYYFSGICSVKYLTELYNENPLSSFSVSIQKIIVKKFKSFIKKDSKFALSTLLDYINTTHNKVPFLLDIIESILINEDTLALDVLDELKIVLILVNNRQCKRSLLELAGQLVKSIAKDMRGTEQEDQALAVLIELLTTIIKGKYLEHDRVSFCYVIVDKLRLLLETEECEKRRSECQSKISSSIELPTLLIMIDLCDDYENITKFLLFIRSLVCRNETIQLYMYHNFLSSKVKLSRSLVNYVERNELSEDIITGIMNRLLEITFEIDSVKSYEGSLIIKNALFFLLSLSFLYKLSRSKSYSSNKLGAIERIQKLMQLTGKLYANHQLIVKVILL